MTTLTASLRDAFVEAASPGRVRFGEPMRLHTTFHIGGPAEVWAEPQNEGELRRLLAVARQAGLPVTVAGGGANLLVRDEGIPGLVIHMGGPLFQIFLQQEDGVVAGAALPLEWLIRRSQEAGLSGSEFLAGVPGQVGGAVRMNAGTRDEEGRMRSMSEILRSVRVMDHGGEARLLEARELRFRCRSCDLAPRPASIQPLVGSAQSADVPAAHESGRGVDGQIVLSAVLALTPDDPEAIARRVERLWEHKKRSQDWSAPSVGCIFKNPPTEVIPAFSRVIPAKSLPSTQSRAGIVPAAGWMIDQTGLKGYRVGNAAFSTRHANFILNLGNASASDVLALIEEARARVLQRFGVELELEVQVLPGGVG